MTDFIRHNLDYGDLEFLKNICMRTKEMEGLSERYWLARRWLDIEAARLEAERFQQTCAVVAEAGKRLATYNGRQLMPSLAWQAKL
jgi:hypothetical protein